MKYTIERLNSVENIEANIYSVRIDSNDKTLYEIFLEENINNYEKEVLDIYKRVNTIALETNAREYFFKTNEGVVGDCVCALYDKPKSNLRLYCIRYAHDLLILGGGGFKPKTISSFQDDDKLKKENYLLRAISKDITERIKNDEITIDENGLNIDDQTEFEIE